MIRGQPTPLTSRPPEYPHYARSSCRQSGLRWVGLGENVGHSMLSYSPLPCKFFHCRGDRTTKLVSLQQPTYGVNWGALESRRTNYSDSTNNSESSLRFTIDLGMDLVSRLWFKCLSEELIECCCDISSVTYKAWRVVIPPIVWGMRPVSWLLFKYLGEG